MRFDQSSHTAKSDRSPWTTISTDRA